MTGPRDDVTASDTFSVDKMPAPLDENEREAIRGHELGPVVVDETHRMSPDLLDGIACHPAPEPDEHEQTCEACGDPFEAAEDTSLCPDCEAGP